MNCSTIFLLFCVTLRNTQRSYGTVTLFQNVDSCLRCIHSSWCAMNAFHFGPLRCYNKSVLICRVKNI